MSELAYNCKNRGEEETAEEEEKEANCSRDMQGSQTVLDHPGSVLAMGEGSGSYKNCRRSADWNVRAGK